MVPLTDIRRFEGPDPSNAELFRAIEAHRLETRERFRDIEGRLSTAVVSREFYLVSHKAMEDRVDNLYAERRDTQNFRRAMIIAVATIMATSLATLLTTLVHIHG